MVAGDEELLVERAVARLVAEARRAAGDGVNLTEVTASRLDLGELATLTAPSLFAEASVLVVRDIQDAGKDVADELAKLAAAPRRAGHPVPEGQQDRGPDLVRAG